MKVISAIEMDLRDTQDFLEAVARLRNILNRHLNPVWTFKNKQMPDIQWDDVHFLHWKSPE